MGQDQASFQSDMQLHGMDHCGWLWVRVQVIHSQLHRMELTGLEEELLSFQELKEPLLVDMELHGMDHCGWL
jgi:hypothetical protein